jgi:hypothetical protein
MSRPNCYKVGRNWDRISKILRLSTIHVHVSMNRALSINHVHGQSVHIKEINFNKIFFDLEIMCSSFVGLRAGFAGFCLLFFCRILQDFRGCKCRIHLSTGQC